MSIEFRISPRIKDCTYILQGTKLRGHIVKELNYPHNWTICVWHRWRSVVIDSSQSREKLITRVAEGEHDKALGVVR